MVSTEVNDFPDSRLELRDGARSDWKKDDRVFRTGSGSSSSLPSNIVETLSSLFSEWSEEVNAVNILAGGGLGSTSGSMGGDVGGVDRMSNFSVTGVDGSGGGITVGVTTNTCADGEGATIDDGV